MLRKQWPVLVGFIALAQGAGLLGSLVTTPSIGSWYSTLTKPELAPPNWVFGPVWTTLFLFMGIAAFLVWQKGAGPKQAKPHVKAQVKTALMLFGLQLALNVFWSYIFFGLQAPGLAVIEIIALWCAILATILAFEHVSKPAAWLMVPYLAWVSFAGYLNYMIWFLNA